MHWIFRKVCVVIYFVQVCLTQTTFNLRSMHWQNRDLLHVMKLYVGKDWKHFVVQNVRKVVASGGFLDLYLKWHIFTVQAQLGPALQIGWVVICLNLQYSHIVTLCLLFLKTNKLLVRARSGDPETSLSYATVSSCLKGFLFSSLAHSGLCDFSGF